MSDTIMALALTALVIIIAIFRLFEWKRIYTRWKAEENAQKQNQSKVATPGSF
jgi:hypothetical protein